MTQREVKRMVNNRERAATAAIRATEPAPVMTAEQAAEATDLLNRTMMRAVEMAEELATLATLAMEISRNLAVTMQERERMRNRPRDPRASVVPISRRGR